MHNRELNTPQTANVIRMPVENFHRILVLPEVQSFRPERQPLPHPCTFNERQTLLFMIVSDLMRFGIKGPLAGSVATRAAEQLLFDPEAEALHIEFRANGASFTFTTDEPPEAASAAGSRRFRLTFDLREYRAAVDVAMSASDAE